MLDFRDDGTIAIDFNAGGQNQQIIVPLPPKIVIQELDLKRVEIQIGAARRAAEIQAQDPPPSPEQVAQIMGDARQWGADQAETWWMLLSEKLSLGFPPADEWPSYLVRGRGVIDSVMEWWNEVPLGRGGQRVQTTS